MHGKLSQENYLSPTVRCPFYMGIYDGVMMQCENHDSSFPKVRPMVKTSGKKELKRYAEAYCCGDYEKCGVYRMIQEKYEAE